MSGTGWQSSDLLARFNLLAGRPTVDAITDATKYQYIADGEQYTIGRISSIKPSVLYGAPAQMTTADGGLTYTFGTDGNGYPLFPMGRATIYPSLSAIPGYAWTPGIDYLDEGITIRMPNNTPYAGPLYWYGITPSQQLSASVQPVLMPPPIRILSVIDGVKNFAESANVRNAELADRMATRFEKEFGEAMTLLRKHFSGGGGLGRLLVPWGVPGGVYGPGWAGAWF
jgi:hypothetical protein